MNIEVNKKILSSFSVIIIVISGTHPKIYSSYKISLKLINIYFSGKANKIKNSIALYN